MKIIISTNNDGDAEIYCDSEDEDCINNLLAAIFAICGLRYKNAERCINAAALDLKMNNTRRALCNDFDL